MAGLLDPDFESELQNAAQGSGAQTLDFLKNVLKGLLYADLQVSGRTITGQIKKGDGTNHAAQVDLSVRTIAVSAVAPAPQVEGTISVATGTSSAAGSLCAHVKTTAAGAFSVTIGGAGAVGVEVVVNKGVGAVVVVS